MTSFNFDEWDRLYRETPVEFERCRKELFDLEISKSPEHHRIALRLLQSECDSISRSLPPLQSSIEISKLMTDKLCQLQNELVNLNEGCLEYHNLLKKS